MTTRQTNDIQVDQDKETAIDDRGAALEVEIFHRGIVHIDFGAERVTSDAIRESHVGREQRRADPFLSLDGHNGFALRKNGRAVDPLDRAAVERVEGIERRHARHLFDHLGARDLGLCMANVFSSLLRYRATLGSR